MPPHQIVKIFCSYAHKDEKLREKLEAHLTALGRLGIATYWTDRWIEPGEDWAALIDQNLRDANVILLLLTANFIASDYCYNVELRQAAARHLAREAVVIPVLLQPCRWNTVTVESGAGTFVLSALQALPEKARPVTKWRNREEAYDNITGGVEAVVERLRAAPPAVKKEPAPTLSAGAGRRTGEVEVALPARPSAPPQPVPELLPYLCDRTTQEKALRAAVQGWRRRGLTKRPLVCIAHGADDEAIDMFRRRLHEVTLPALLSAKGEDGAAPLHDPAAGRLEDQFIPLPTSYVAPASPYEFLQEEVGQPVAGDMYAEDKLLAAALSARKTPTFFHSNLATGDWDGEGELIVEAFLKFWGSLPDVRAGRVLSFLFFKYDTSAGGAARLAELNARARAYFDGLRQSLERDARVHGVVLPALGPVEKRDAENWVRSDTHFVKLCRQHASCFCDVSAAQREIERIYGDPLARIPMKQLAPQLHAAIQEHRCPPGAV